MAKYSDWKQSALDRSDAKHGADTYDKEPPGKAKKKKTKRYAVEMLYTGRDDSLMIFSKTKWTVWKKYNTEADAQKAIDSRQRTIWGDNFKFRIVPIGKNKK